MIIFNIVDLIIKSSRQPIKNHMRNAYIQDEVNRINGEVVIVPTVFKSRVLRKIRLKFCKSKHVEKCYLPLIGDACAIKLTFIYSMTVQQS